VIIWLALGSAAVWLDLHTAGQMHLCTFKHISGIPCPACGFSRGMLSLSKGNLLECWSYNPLLFSLMGVFFILTILRIFFGKKLKIKLEHGERTLAWIAAVALLIANWVYIILYVG